MKTIEVDGRSYRLKILPPWFQAEIQRYSMLARKVPQSEGDADKIQGDMKRVFDRIFTVVDPKPVDEDAGEVFIALLSHLNESVQEANRAARLFREDQAGQDGG